MERALFRGYYFPTSNLRSQRSRQKSFNFIKEHYLCLFWATFEYIIMGECIFFKKKLDNIWPTLFVKIGFFQVEIKKICCWNCCSCLSNRLRRNRSSHTWRVENTPWINYPEQLDCFLDPALDLIPDPDLLEATIFLNNFETASLLDQPVVILICWHFHFLLCRLFYIKDTQNSVVMGNFKLERKWAKKLIWTPCFEQMFYLCNSQKKFVTIFWVNC